MSPTNPTEPTRNTGGLRELRTWLETRILSARGTGIDRLKTLIDSLTIARFNGDEATYEIVLAFFALGYGGKFVGEVVLPWCRRTRMPPEPADTPESRFIPVAILRDDSHLPAKAQQFCFAVHGEGQSTLYQELAQWWSSRTLRPLSKTSCETALPWPAAPVPPWPRDHGWFEIKGEDTAAIPGRVSQGNLALLIPVTTSQINPNNPDTLVGVVLSVPTWKEEDLQFLQHAIEELTRLAARGDVTPPHWDPDEIDLSTPGAPVAAVPTLPGGEGPRFTKAALHRLWDDLRVYAADGTLAADRFLVIIRHTEVTDGVDQLKDRARFVFFQQQWLDMKARLQKWLRDQKYGLTEHLLRCAAVLMFQHKDSASEVLEALADYFGLTPLASLSETANEPFERRLEDAWAPHDRTRLYSDAAGKASTSSNEEFYSLWRSITTALTRVSFPLDVVLSNSSMDSACPELVGGWAADPRLTSTPLKYQTEGLERVYPAHLLLAEVAAFDVAFNRDGVLYLPMVAPAIDAPNEDVPPAFAVVMLVGSDVDPVVAARIVQDHAPAVHQAVLSDLFDTTTSELVHAKTEETMLRVVRQGIVSALSLSTRVRRVVSFDADEDRDLVVGQTQYSLGDATDAERLASTGISVVSDSPPFKSHQQFGELLAQLFIARSQGARSREVHAVVPALNHILSHWIPVVARNADVIHKAADFDRPTFDRLYAAIQGLRATYCRINWSPTQGRKWTPVDLLKQEEENLLLGEITERLRQAVNAWEVTQKAALGCRIDFRCDLGGNEGRMVHLDVILFETAMFQLLINATQQLKKAMLKAGRIHFVVSAGAQSLRVTCSDNGPGMTESTRKRIQDMDGGGLGYHLVRELTKQARGSFCITKIEDGLTVSLEIPYGPKGHPGPGGENG